jgi:hypothetical protein
VATTLTVVETMTIPSILEVLVVIGYCHGLECLYRDSISSDVVEANPAAPAVVQACILGYKDGDGGGVSIKSSQDDIPEWRRPGGGGCGGLLPPNSWRKPYDEEPVGNAFAASYSPRPGPPCTNTNGPTLRPPHNRPATLIPPGRWERFGDRDHEQGHPLHDREGDEPGKVCCFCISRCIHSRGLLIQGPQELIGPEVQNR